MISVVVPVLNGGTDLDRCLGAIASQRVDDQVEVVVIDSDSDDDSAGLARRRGARVVEIERAQFNHGATRNLGARLAGGEILVFTSQDAYAEDERWLGRLTAPLCDDPELAGVYGRQLAHHSAGPAEQFFLGHMYAERPLRQRAATQGELSVDSTMFSNANSALRRDVWERFPFAESLIMAEDQEWAARVLLAGYALAYEPGAAVRHSHAYTLRSAFRRFFDLGVAAEHSFLAGGRASGSALRRRTLAYARDELRWLRETGRMRQLPATGLYEATKLLGLLAGSRHRSLPLAWRQRLSATPSYWR